MKYTEPKFTVAVGGEAYAEGWDRIFGKRDDEATRVIVASASKLEETPTFVAPIYNGPPTVETCCWCGHEASDHSHASDGGFACRDPFSCVARARGIYDFEAAP